ncbi:MAG: mycofactocin radical SAM maturase [Microthrixaceae bacterium]|nr:mycofactocin radical SAM maturase [Microthrixaceae bacterium]
MEHFKEGLAAPICLTWELTYACNLACVHCLSSSGRRHPRELTTEECFRVVDELARMQVFYVNIGGGEPMLRRDFFHVLAYAESHDVGVKFSTNGTFLDAAAAHRLADMDYVDVQVSIDGATADVNDLVRGEGSHEAALAAMRHLSEADFGPFKVSIVATRHNIDQLDDFKALSDDLGAQLRITRLRPSGRGVDSWEDLHPTQAQQRRLYHWLLERPDVLTGDSFFHLSALGEPLPGLNLCGAGRVVCLIDPVGDVYACPFVIHDEFRAGNVRDEGGLPGCGPTARCSLRCGSPAIPGRARAAAATTPARAGAWRRSSSWASTSPTRIRSASTARPMRSSQRSQWDPSVRVPMRRVRVDRSAPGRRWIARVRARLCRWRSRDVGPGEPSTNSRPASRNNRHV